MKVQLAEGVEITIDPNRLLDAMTKEQREDMVSYLSCHDTIINNVKEQLIHGVFIPGDQGGWSGAIDKAQREVVSALDDMYKREIERLERDLLSSKELAQEGWEAYHAFCRLRGQV